MAGGEGVAVAAAAAAEGTEAGKGGKYDSKCVFCRIARREEPGTALLSSELQDKDLFRKEWIGKLREHMPAMPSALQIPQFPTW